MRSEYIYNNKNGSAVLVTMILTFIISIMVATAIRFVVHEHKFSVDSERWAQALHTAEAGVELAIAAIQQDVKAAAGITNAYDWVAGGWSHPNDDVWTKALDNLSPTDHNPPPNARYTVSINTNTLVVTGTGILPGVYNNATNSRSIQVTLQPDYMQYFEKGMLGRDVINFGGNPNCDSYNSEDGAYGGFNVDDNCSVASMSPDVGGVTGGGAPVVNGDVYVTETGDAEGDFWTGGEHSDLDVEIPPYIPDRTDTPDGSWSGGEVYTVPSALVGADNYLGITKVKILGVDKTVTIQGEGEITIYCSGNVDFGTSDTLSIEPTPGKILKVTLICDGSLLNLLGVLNDSGRPGDLMIYGTDNCTEMNISASEDKYCCVYAPNAEVKLTGDAALFGSVVGKELDVIGNFDFHYDESLATNSAPILVGFDIASWREL